MLSEGVPLREISGHIGLSRSALQRHAAHRLDRDRVALQLAELSRPAPSIEEVRYVHRHSPLGRLHARLSELAEQTAAVGQVAAASRDPALLLRAVKTESELLSRIADRFAADPESVFSDARDACLRVVGTVIHQQIADDELQSRLVTAINAELVNSGIEGGS